MGRSRTGLRRWSVAALGAVALGGVGALALPVGPLPDVTPADAAMPGLLAALLLLGGVSVGRSALADDAAAQVAAWTVGGAAVVGALVVAQFLNPFADATLAPAALALAATAGADFGALAGYQAVRRQAEESVADAAMAASTDGIAVLDERFRYRAANDAYADLYRVEDPATLAGDTWRCSRYREAPDAFAATLREDVARTGRWRGEAAGVRPDDSRFPTELTVAPLDDGGFVVVVRDVTERRRHERRLDALHGGTRSLFAADTSEAVLSAAVAVAADAFDGDPAATWTPDEDGTLRPAVASRGDPDDLPVLPADSAAARAFRSGTVEVTDWPAAADAGDPDTAVLVPLGDRALLAVLGPDPGSVPEADRNLLEIFGRDAAAALDAVEREARLTRREERLRTVVENAPLLLYVFDPHGEITLVEGEGLAAFPLSAAELVGRSVFEVFEGSQELVEAADRALGGERVEDSTTIGDRVYEFTSQPVVEGGAVARVVGVAVDVTDRVRYENRVVALHEATREMLTADTPAAVCEVVVETSRVLLDQPISGVWRASDHGDGPHLEPVTATEAAREVLGELPAYVPGESISWGVYESGETAVVDDLDAEDGHAAPPGMRSLLVAPIGDFGVLVCGAMEPAAFDETDVALANLLAANAATAVERVRREQTLQGQTDRMEFFNAILRHDVLNGMTVIRGRAELLADTLEPEAGGRHADTIVRWSDDVTDVVTRVRSVLETVTDPEAVHLQAVDLSATLDVEVDRVRATYPAVALETDVPDGLLVTADELLGEVLGNVLTNAVEHNDTDGLHVRVTAEHRGDTVVVTIADDGRGVPADSREGVFRRGETSRDARTGSGFGLFFVDAMVAAYGGEVRVEESDAGGAAFVLRLPAGGRHADGGRAEGGDG